MGIAVLPLPEEEGSVDRYVLGKRIAAERRTGSSLLRGIMDKTLFTGALYLREHFEIAVLIVEGEVDYSYTAFDPRAVRGAVSAMLLEYGVSVLATSDLDETVQMLVMMARQEQMGIPEISLIPKRKAVDLPDMQRRVVEMLPGVGMVTARDLLQHFGSVRAILEAGPDELREVKGIGAKKARQIVRVVEAEYGAVDTERDLEDAIEAEPALLFDGPADLLGRQHYIFSDEEERHFVDLVFLVGDELVLVELKRGPIGRAHAGQLRRYLDRADQSPMLRERIEAGPPVRGVLASTADSEFDPADPDISVVQVDEARAIEVLKRLRRRRLEEG
jgi:ERCC4-type nuclease